MIKYFNDYEKIKELWQICFGDSEEYIDFFLNNCKNKKCLGFFIDEKLVSMFFLISCSITNNTVDRIVEDFKTLNGDYIFAACTHPDYRSKGYMASLIEFEKANKEKDFLCLVPAENTLFNYYSKFGFETKLYSHQYTEYTTISNINFLEKNNKLKTLSFAEYNKTRKTLTEQFSSLNWTDEEFFYKENLLNKGFFIMENERLLAIRDNLIIENIGKNFDFDFPRGMVYSKSKIENTYIGLVLD